MESDTSIGAHNNSATLHSQTIQHGIRSIHASLEFQRTFIESVFAQEYFSNSHQAVIWRSLVSPRPNYSCGVNKAILLACAANATSIHRRDSDTYVFKAGDLPIVVELSYLGKTAATIVQLPATSTVFDVQRPIVGVGTDYTGDVPLDRSEFVEYFPELLLCHEQVIHPDKCGEELQRIVDRKYHRSEQPGQPGSLGYDESGDVEMGCVAFLDPTAIAPELPVDQTLGSDYFHKNLTFRLQQPVLYHGARVAHENRERSDRVVSLDAYVDYALRDVRFKLMKTVWRVLNGEIAQHVASGSHITLQHFIADGYQKCIRAASCGVSPQTLTRTVDATAMIYQLAAKQAEQSGLGIRAHLAAADFEIRKQRENMIADIMAAFVDYAELVSIWPRLVSAASKLHLTYPTDGGPAQIWPRRTKEAPYS